MKSEKKANLAGVGALFSWGFMTALLRMTMEAFGTMFGIALVYTLGAVALFVADRPTRLRDVPRRYLLLCAPLFIAYEALLALAVGSASTRAQVLEVSILNYLWPTMLVIMLVITTVSGRARMLLRLMPGTVIAIAGIVLCVGGDDVLEGAPLFSSAINDPIPDLMAITAAFLWASYSNLAPKLSNGTNATAYFFAAIALLLWIALIIQGDSVFPAAVAPQSVLTLLGTVLSVTLGYALWNYGIEHGDMRFLSSASYIAPLPSCLFSTLILGILPTAAFWVGAVLLIGGTLSSYFVMDKKSRKALAES